MTNPPAQVGEMRARGYDDATIREAVVRQIRAAFHNVRLGTGIGLNEGQVLDDYGSDQERAIARERDEKDDWSVIAEHKLNECCSSLSFFDAEGMRFHLPSFMLAEINDKFWYGLAFHLVRANGRPEQFTLLNKEQRTAVRDFIDYMIDRSAPEYDTVAMRAARYTAWGHGDV